ncbi:hypothetical protein PUNSTDRAFT_55593, partial [Punctularia strigosozonata HHB-11173 SS5]
MQHVAMSFSVVDMVQAGVADYVDSVQETAFANRPPIESRDIECTVSQDPLDPAHTSLITVTTPTGTVTISSAASAPLFAHPHPVTAKDKEKPMTTPGQVLQSSVEVASEVHARERERERDRERGSEASGSGKIPVPMAVDDPEHFPPTLLFVQKLRTRTDPETYA